MNFKIGSQPRIADVTPAETAVDSNIGITQNTTPAEVHANSMTSAGKTALKSEAAFSASALQSTLLKQVEAKAPDASVSDAQPQSTRDLVGNFNFGHFPSIGDKGLVAEKRLDAKVVKPLGRDEAKAYFLLPKTLSTGDGNDNVDIRMGNDGRVHVNVNGKEAWSGTTREFQALTINTGGGTDVVNNQVNGAKINTGADDDVVTNNSNGTLIDVGEGTNKVNSAGSGNEIYAGSGNDTIRSDGHGNVIGTADGDDLVSIAGSGNKVRTEGGHDRVDVSNQYVDGNVDDLFEERDKRVASDSNDIDTGDGIDSVYNGTSSTTINTGAGNDYVQNSGDFATINTGEGQDMVYNTGRDSMINTGEDNDYISNTGGAGTLIQTGEGEDTVLVSENHGIDDRYYDPVKPVQVETGGDGDTVYNTDGSKLIMDGE